MIESPNGKPAAASMAHNVTRAIETQLKNLDIAQAQAARENDCVKAFITKVKGLELTEEEAEGFLLMVSR